MSKKKSKKIIIEFKETETTTDCSLTSNGFTKFEILGILRFYEQQTSIEILQQMNPPKSNG